MKPRQNYTPREKSQFDLACEALIKRHKEMPPRTRWGGPDVDCYGLDLPSLDNIEGTPRPAVLVFRQTSLFELAEVAA